VVQRWQRQRPVASLQRSLHWRELLDRLSPRERYVFEAIGQGMASKEIARMLELSVSTVETYHKSISAKLDLSGAELVRAAALHRCTNAG